MSQIIQSCFIEEYEFKDKQGNVKKCSLDKKQKLNVRSLYRVLKVLVDEGYGDYVYIDIDGQGNIKNADLLSGIWIHIPFFFFLVLKSAYQRCGKKATSNLAQ